MPAYDSTAFQPPAPVARVTIKTPDASTTIPDVPMLLDSGADVSLLPRFALASILQSRDDLPHYDLAGYDGHVSTAPAIDVEVIFLGKSFRGRFLIVDDRCGILGRNVLHRISLLLDSPRLLWNESG